MRIKDICDLVSRGCTPNYVEESPYKVMNQATFSKGFLDESSIRFTDSVNPIAKIHKGDLLMASTGGGVLGKVFYFDSDDDSFCADSHVSILRSYKNSMKFLYYYFSIRYELINSTMVKGSTNQTELQRNYLLNHHVEIPDFTIQERIVEYLDNKTSVIDKRIAALKIKVHLYIRKKQCIINEVTSKGLNHRGTYHRSTILHTDEIPKEWQFYRIKDIGYLYGGLSGKSGEDFRSEDNSRRKPYIPFTNILNNTYIDESQYNYVVMEDGECQNEVKKNDLLFLMSSEDYESIAKTAVVKNDIGEVYLNSFCKGVRFYNENLVYAPFVNYQLSSTKFRDYLRFEARGFTRINIKVDKINSMFVYLPPLEEQKAIVAYLDDKCAKIDAIVSNINSQIEKLQLLKKSLINDVISGRRKV